MWFEAIGEFVLLLVETVFALLYVVGLLLMGGLLLFVALLPLWGVLILLALGISAR